MFSLSSINSVTCRMGRAPSACNALPERLGTALGKPKSCEADQPVKIGFFQLMRSIFNDNEITVRFGDRKSPGGHFLQRLRNPAHPGAGWIKVGYSRLSFDIATPPRSRNPGNTNPADPLGTQSNDRSRPWPHSSDWPVCSGISCGI